MPVPVTLAAGVLIAFVAIALPLGGIYVYIEIAAGSATRVILQGLAATVIVSAATAITTVEGGAMLAEKYTQAKREQGREEGRKEREEEVARLKAQIKELEIAKLKAQIEELEDGSKEPAA